MVCGRARTQVPLHHLLGAGGRLACHVSRQTWACRSCMQQRVLSRSSNGVCRLGLGAGLSESIIVFTRGALRVFSLNKGWRSKHGKH